MGYDDHDGAYEVGKAILEKVGVLTECFAGCMYYRLEENAKPAYMMAAKLVKDNDPLVEGMSLTEVRDGIKHAFDDHPSDECTHRKHDD